MASKVKMRPLINCCVNNGLSATLLILFLLHIAMPQDDAGGYFITTELMHGMRLRTGGRDQFSHQWRDGCDQPFLAACVNGSVPLHIAAGLPIAQKMLPKARQGAERPLWLARCSTSSGTAYS